VTDRHSLFSDTNCKIICEDFVDSKHGCNFVNWEPTGNFSTFKKFPEHHSKNFLNIIMGKFSTFKKIPEHHSIMACQPDAGRA
jgi:hypothetical protein